MRTYILSIAVSTVISAVMNMLTPEKWSKYVGVVTGLVVMMCIATPIISIINNDTMAEFSYTAEVGQKDGSAVLYAEIKAELERRISNDVCNRLKREFDRECTADTEVIMTDKGEVSGVRRIRIYGDKTDAVITGRLREVYGAEDVRYEGLGKTY